MLSATLRGIYSAALYQYAVGGDTGEFSGEVLAGAFRPKSVTRAVLMRGGAPAGSDSPRAIG